MPSSLTTAIQFSVDCLQAACGMAARWEARGPVGSDAKPDGSRVTEIDYAVQAYVGRQLASCLPNDVLVAEEGVSLLKKNPLALERALSCLSTLVPEAEERSVIEWLGRGEGMPGSRHWLLDPVDSTNGLLAGGLYCLNLALVENGRVEMAVIGLPKPFVPWFPAPNVTSGYLYLAVRGAGSWWAPLDESIPFMRLQVSNQTDVAKAVRLRSLARTDPRQTKKDARRRAKVSKAFGEEGGHIRAPAPIRYPLLAVGQADLYIHLDSSAGRRGRKAPKGMKAWDHAAGSLLVEEAGGRVTDLAGRPLDFSTGRILSNNRGLLASNGQVHPAALELLRRIGEGKG